eukprot:scaffold77293_cov24-Tisochrysis_lutea.AAC.1
MHQTCPKAVQTACWLAPTFHEPAPYLELGRSGSRYWRCPCKGVGCLATTELAMFGKRGPRRQVHCPVLSASISVVKAYKR